MRLKKASVPLILIVVIYFCLFSMPYETCRAEQTQLNFGKNVYYDIYYQAENNVQYVLNVKVMDTATIAGKIFLVIQSSNLPTENSGYISVSNVIAILPTGSPKPQ